MNTMFEHTVSNWVRYDKYELKKDDKGELYITPADGAMPDIYNIMKYSEQIVLDALNTALFIMRKPSEREIENSIMDFVSKYGLLGLITTITTTSEFMDYEQVHFIKNRFIKTETMETEEYLSYFFPFEMPKIQKNGINSKWDIESDNTMMALALTMGNRPLAVNMSLQRIYAEPFEWVKKQFLDWATLFVSTTFFYDRSKNSEPPSRDLYQQMIEMFNANAPTYHIALYDKPTLVWNFDALAIAVQMLFNISLTDEKNPLRICKQCAKAFIASRPSAVFCSPRCKNQFNVYKSRAKNKNEN